MNFGVNNNEVTTLATLGQRLLWALDRVRGETGALSCPMLCSITGPLELPQLQEAINTLVASHSALRTTIVPGRVLKQRVHSPTSVRVDVRDTDAASVGALVKQKLSRRVDPTLSPIEITWFRTASDASVLLMNVHHIVTDLASSRVLVEDLIDALAGRAVRRDSWDLASYSAWEHQHVASGALAPSQRYWFERLARMSALQLPFLASRADACGSTGVIELSLEASTRARLERIARVTKTSLFTVLLSVFFAMRWRQTGDKDLAVASLFDNRSRHEMHRTVAFLVNLLVLRVRVGGAPTFADFVHHSERAISGALSHATLPFHAISPRPPVTLRGPARVDDVVFHAVPNRIDRVHTEGQLMIEELVPEVCGRFDFEMAVRPRADDLVVRVTYNEHRLAASCARDLLNAYVEMASAANVEGAEE